MMFEILRSALIEFGVDVKNFEVDETGKIWFEIDFSEHDKMVAEEKDKRIAELEKIINEKLGKWDNLGITFAEILELEDRHQSDCIRINQLLTTIDVLTERYQKLREVYGL